MSQWKQGDTLPDMVIDCFDDGGSRANLDDASLVRVIVSQRGVTKWERDIPVEDRANGSIIVPLQASDTATVGTFFVKVYVEWPNGSRQHYPPADRFVRFTVTR